MATKLPMHDDSAGHLDFGLSLEEKQALTEQHFFVRERTKELARRRSKDGVLEIGVNAQRLGDSTLAAMAPEGPPSDLACKKGCSWCCYLHVDATWPEVFVLAEFIVTTWSTAERDALAERLGRTVQRIDGLEVDKRAFARVPCALLLEGRCGTYDLRPLRCRSYTSFSERACKRALRPGRDSPSESWGVPMLAYDPVYTGVTIGLEEVGFPAVVELNRGLLYALTTDGALARWQAQMGRPSGEAWLTAVPIVDQGAQTATTTCDEDEVSRRSKTEEGQ